jgi:hypothetical protein
MHERLSVHSVCFRDAGFQELARYWRELDMQRVSLYSGLIEKEGLTAAEAALGAGPFLAETITHTFLSTGHTLDSQDGILRNGTRTPRSRHCRCNNAACPVDRTLHGRAGHHDLGRRGGAFRRSGRVVSCAGRYLAI